MTDIAALESYAGRLSEAADIAQSSAAIQRLIVHGDEFTEVQTDSGPVPSLAKQAVLAQKMIKESLALVASQLAGSMSYQSVSAGLLGTKPGAFFSVPIADSEDALVIYENSSGVEKEYARLSSSQYLKSLAQTVAAVEEKIEGFAKSKSLEDLSRRQEVVEEELKRFSQLGSLDGIAKKIAELSSEAKSPSWEKKIEALSNKSQRFEEKMDTQAEKLKNIGKDGARMEKEYATLASSVISLATSQNHLKENLHSKFADSTEKFARLFASMQAWEKSLIERENKIYRKIEASAYDDTAQKEQIAKVSSSVLGFITSSNELDEKISLETHARKKGIQGLEKDVSLQKERTESLYSKQAENEARTLVLEADQAKGEARTLVLEAKQTKAESRTEGLEVKQTKAEARTERLEVKQTKVEARTERLEIKQAKAEALTEGLEANQAKAEALTECLEAKLAEAQTRTDDIETDQLKAEARTESLEESVKELEKPWWASYTFRLPAAYGWALFKKKRKK